MIRACLFRSPLFTIAVYFSISAASAAAAAFVGALALFFAQRKEKGVYIRREELQRQLGRTLDASASKATSRSSQCDSCECAADGE